MTCTPTSSPTRRAAAAPASVAAFTDPTSPRTMAVTRPASTFCQPTKTTLAVLHMASAASIMPTSPRVSTMPRASPTSRFSLLSAMRQTILDDSSAGGHRQRVNHAIAFHETHDVHQVRDDAGMIRHDPDAIAGLQRGGAGDFDGRMLLAQALDEERVVFRARRLAVAGEDRAEASGV